MSKLHAFGFEGFPEFLGLHHVARESVQQPAVFPFGLKRFQNHGNGDVVGHEIAAINVGFCFFSEFGAAADVFAENGPGFDVGKIVFLFDQSALSAFAAAVGAEDQNIHWKTS